jgi:hypothetical protein
MDSIDIFAGTNHLIYWSTSCYIQHTSGFRRHPLRWENPNDVNVNVHDDTIEVYDYCEPYSARSDHTMLEWCVIIENFETKWGLGFESELSFGNDKQLEYCIQYENKTLNVIKKGNIIRHRKMQFAKFKMIDVIFRIKNNKGSCQIFINGIDFGNVWKSLPKNVNFYPGVTLYVGRYRIRHHH